jgi:hypothetical protein
MDDGQKKSNAFDIEFKFNLPIPSLTDMLEWLRREFPPEPRRIRTMTYSEAIRYFVEESPQEAQRGVMLRERHSGGQLFTQVFLDGENQVVRSKDGRVQGRQLIIREFDPELTTCFGDKDLVVVE